MKKIFSIILIVLLLFSFTACDILPELPNDGGGNTTPPVGGDVVDTPSDGANPNPDDGNGSTNPPDGGDNTTPAPDDGVSPSPDDGVVTDYDVFFDLNTKVEIVIKMSSSELIKLNEDFKHYSYNGGKSPLNRCADVDIKFDGKTFSYTQVGIKMKGNTSRREFLNENNQVDDLIHYKLDFAETFNDDYYDGSTYTLDQPKAERKERRFLDMKKLDLKWNKNYDATHVKQLYAYEMFEAFGVMALNVNLGKISLQIDGQQPQSLGVFEILEVVDEAFLSRRLPAEELGGDLYKVGYTGMGKGDLTLDNIDQKIGVEDEDANYFPPYDLKTNKKTSDHSSLKNLIKFLNSNNVTQQTLEQYVDMPSFLMEEAVAYVLGNPDDFRNNYNNYYIYFGAQSNKAYFMPYDWDRCLGITKDWDPTGSAMTQVKHNSNYAQGSKEMQRNPLMRYTVGREDVVIKYFNDIYVQYVKDIFASEWCTNDKFNSYFLIAKGNYATDVKPSFPLIANMYVAFENASNGIDSNMSFSAYMSAKKATFQNNL